MFSFLGHLFSGVFLAVSSFFVPVSGVPAVSPLAMPASSTESIGIQPAVKHSVKTPAPIAVPAVVAPVLAVTIPPATPEAPKPVITSQEAQTQTYYENGQYVQMTDEQHQALLQQVQDKLSELQAADSSARADMRSLQAKIAAACASTLNSSPVQMGNGAVTAMAAAEECSSVAQAYRLSIQIDQQNSASDEQQIQMIEAAYN